MNLAHRQRRHLSDLFCNKHHNKHLQRAYRKYGEDILRWEVLERDLDKNDILVREQFWIDALLANLGKSVLLNHCLVAGNCAGITQSPETIAKRVAKVKGQKRSPEFRAMLSEMCKGRRHTEEARKKMSISKRGKRQSTETIAKRVAKIKGCKRPDNVTRQTGTIHSSEWKSKQSIGQLQSIKSSHNELGVKGIYRCWNQYRARVMIGGKSIHLGLFKTIEEAVTARERIVAKRLIDECSSKRG